MRTTRTLLYAVLGVALLAGCTAVGSGGSAGPQDPMTETMVVLTTQVVDPSPTPHASTSPSHVPTSSASSRPAPPSSTGPTGPTEVGAAGSPGVPPTAEMLAALPDRMPYRLDIPPGWAVTDCATHEGIVLGGRTVGFSANMDAMDGAYRIYVGLDDNPPSDDPVLAMPPETIAGRSWTLVEPRQGADGAGGPDLRTRVGNLYVYIGTEGAADPERVGVSVKLARELAAHMTFVANGDDPTTWFPKETVFR